ncbi:hypothetical protein ACFVUH_23440 [Kitasatospora sp. NPDC058032]|uniref:hypothetical protein n=1 Tax=Kitasatospora sp. NPDC058032 TaxID=3346307 RepID=UPI0036DB50C2
MRKRRTPWAVLYGLIGAVFLLIAVSMTAFFARVDDLIPIVLCGVPGLVLTFRAPIFGVSFGSAGVKYSGLLVSRSYAWSEIEEVRSVVVSGTLLSSSLPELVLTSGKAQQMPMLAGYAGDDARNGRVERLVADLDRARTGASAQGG